MFRLTIDTDNDAFQVDRTAELARCLRRSANTLQFGPSGNVKGSIQDSNGNTVGTWELR